MENEKDELAPEVDTVDTDTDATENAPEEPLTVDEEPKAATDDPSPKQDAKDMIMRALSGIFDFVEILAFSVCIVLVAFSFLGRLCAVSGQSMEQTLYNGEQLLISNLGGPAKPGDIVVFHMTVENPYSFLNEPLVKRVIATGGDTVQIDYDARKVYVNGQPVEDEELFAHLDGGCYCDSGGFVYTGKTDPITVPDGYLYVMGDNRNHSTDSRDPAISFVDERRVLGKVVCRLSPFDWADDLKGNAN